MHDECISNLVRFFRWLADGGRGSCSSIRNLSARLAYAKTLSVPRSKGDKDDAHASNMRTLLRENARTDPEWAAKMKLSMELLSDVKSIGYHMAEDEILLDEPDLKARPPGFGGMG